jgi:histidine ammonia-lyase
MGTIAARDAERICILTERVLAIHLLAAAQGCEIRGNLDVRPPLSGLIGQIRSLSEALLEDREMDMDIERIAAAISESDLFGR